MHARGQDIETCERASQALHNIIHARCDEKVGRREVRVLCSFKQIRDHCQMLRISLNTEPHRHAICQLGGLHAVAELIEMDHAAHGNNSNDSTCITLRRYAGMALTNLTFGDVLQLQSISDDLRQVTASVLRILSWRADIGSLKKHYANTNKVDICAVDGALCFLIDMLSYNIPSKTLAIIENAGGILRNVSSHIAVRDDYRKIGRERGCLQVLLSQLRSPSLTVVSNACGAWNLSAYCLHDQRLLWDLGAVPMLRSLVHSKHKMISMGSIEPSTSPIAKDNNNNKFTFNETNFNFNDITRLKTSYQRNKFDNNNSNSNGVLRYENQ
ncbi:hypothetical protein HCN44_004861 [Aphidius gifuensis]|uniref:Uncharacterized protein n=1 Tax=Aphidius gifuensis TaxID=684658 RepID=A0A834XU30_APHGI|nr:hypothetical protein HCN44_004861 [Aphidius gifuensis]